MHNKTSDTDFFSLNIRLSVMIPAESHFTELELRLEAPFEEALIKLIFLIRKKWSLLITKYIQCHVEISMKTMSP